MLERSRRKQGLASDIPHITINQGQRSEGFYVCSRDAVVCKKKRKKKTNVSVRLFLKTFVHMTFL